MRKIIKICLFSVLLASASAIAAEQQHMSREAMQAMTKDAGQAVQWSDGVVTKVDQKKSQITLKPAAVANVMPAMTMSYHVVPTASLKSMHAGEMVRFVLVKDNEAYVLTHIEVLR